METTERSGGLIAPARYWWVPHAVLVMTSLRHIWSSVGDWPNLVQASELLFGRATVRWPRPGGLDLFANYPELQTGPLSIAVATPLRLLGESGRRLAVVTMLVAGLVVLDILRRLSRHAGMGDRPGPILAGVVVAVTWVPLAAGYLHLDDVITIVAVIGATLCLVQGPGWCVGLLLGLGVAAKPWGVLFVPLMAVVPATERKKTAAVFAAVCGAAWLPFVVAAPGTLGAASPTVDVSPSSVLHLFGVPRGLGPEWVRSAQLGVGLALGSVAVVRGRWTAVPLVAIAARVALDPGVFSYYTAGLAVGAAVFDLTSSRRPVPWATLGVFFGVSLPELLVTNPAVSAGLRLVTCVGLIGLGLSARSEFCIGVVRPHPGEQGAPADSAWPSVDPGAEVRR